MATQRRLAKVGRVVLAFGLAIMLAFSSALVQRSGPEVAPYGDPCGPSGNDLCLDPVLNGGFPFAYLFDAPGVSRERQLAFVEDDLRTLPLVLDILVYFVATLLATLVISRCWAALKRAANHADA